VNAKKGPAAARDRRSTQALEQYEKAVKALGKRDYEKARDAFDATIDGFPEERDVAERARLFRGLCERALDKRAAYKPKTFEDLLNHGVVLHNRGEFLEALKVLGQAAEIHPKNEHVLYCTAASAARAGDAATALKALKGAIQANGANRAQALVDEDFEALRDSDEFEDLVEAPLD
jgi:tetratricopeptide (TPR) repeat protein